MSDHKISAQSEFLRFSIGNIQRKDRQKLCRKSKEYNSHTLKFHMDWPPIFKGKKTIDILYLEQNQNYGKGDN